MITGDLLAAIPFFAPLADRDRDAIAVRAADVRLQAGEWLIQQGEIPAFFVVLDGVLDVLKEFCGAEQSIARWGPGDHFGELPLLLGTTTIASIRARVPSRVLRLDAADFQTAIVRHPALSAVLLRSVARHVHQLEQITIAAPDARVQIVGHRDDPAGLTVRDFLARNHIPFVWLDLDQPEDQDEIPPDARRADSWPLVLFPDGATLTNPGARMLAERLGLQTTPAAARYDLAVLGAGPAGLAAAVYGASEGLRTVLIEREAPGGQAGTSSRIENYLGFPAGLSGDELSQRAWQQARRFGAEILVARAVEGIAVNLDTRDVLLDGGERVRCRAVVIATGVSWRRLGVPGSERLVGRGVYYGAARTEAPATRGKEVYLIGGGNSAGQAALLFSGYARRVTLLVRGSSLAAGMSQYLIDQIAAKENIVAAVRSEVVQVYGDQHLEAIVVRDHARGTERMEPTEGLFIFIGADAETDWLSPAIARDARGYIRTGHDVAADAESGWPLARDPYLLETSVPGIFAAGDVRHDSIKRVASGVGEGSMAVAFVHQYLATLPEETAH